MPGTNTSVILKRYKELNGNFQVLNMAYDGQEQSNILTRLEAFMYQARQYRERMREGHSLSPPAGGRPLRG